MRQILTSLAVLTVLFAAPTFSSADSILWEQAPTPNPANGLINVVTPQGDQEEDFSTALVNDVTFQTDVRISSVTTYFSDVNVSPWTNGGVFNAVLNIFDGDPLTDADAAFDGGDFGSAVQVTALDPNNSGFDGVWSLTVSGLNLTLDAGTYFFGLTPEHNGNEGQEFHVNSATDFGSPTFFRNPANGFGTGTGWQEVGNLVPAQSDFEASITIRAVPEPTAAGLLALGLVGLTTRRRR